MEAVHRIKQMVAQMSEDDLAQFRAWFEVFDAEAWDEQLESDVHVGKLDKLAERAVADYRAGKCREL